MTYVLGSNETLGIVISDLINRSESTVGDISLLMAVLAGKLKDHQDPANIQHQALIDEAISLSTLIRIHFKSVPG